MLVVNKSSNNEWILTLNEKQTLTNPTYLFRVISDFNRTEKTFIAFDTSSYPNRYNSFTITESATEILTSGTVYFNPTGFWSYEVYEQTSTTNLDYTLVTNRTPLEVGRIKVIGSDSVVYKYQQTTTYKGYGNGQL